ncbi:hypothetical protein CC78DRAFT_582509 [Lojkania enalia]|uniref:Uncharacterized protein n=1 Tax=Lojkania enalia TaxID=147567 RepID=A0A9P4K7S2_9PLEO|nr:hypothetical protein CC78DRAFT_582509 [Didymosphaeria enalia]
MSVMDKGPPYELSTLIAGRKIVDIETSQARTVVVLRDSSQNGITRQLVRQLQRLGSQVLISTLDDDVSEATHITLTWIWKVAKPESSSNLGEAEFEIAILEVAANFHDLTLATGILSHDFRDVELGIGFSASGDDDFGMATGRTFTLVV